MLVLGLETSCDETAAAVVQDGIFPQSTAVSSQISSHAAYGGVVPELAAREHLTNLDRVVETALQDAEMSITDIHGVAVTYTPGLLPALLVGLSYAKGIAFAGGLPLIGLNHFQAHIYSCFMEEPELLTTPGMFPALALVVSGGHTHLVLIQTDGSAEIIGQTIDDASGEAFDKAAQILSLGYPGGPAIQQAAEKGSGEAFNFPRGLTGGRGKPVSPENRFNFSFSGLKTSLLYRVDNRELSEEETADLAASYQAAVIDVLVSKTIDAVKEYGVGTVLLSGGVAANDPLRQAFQNAAEKVGRRLVIAPSRFCTDNGAMIAGAGYYYLQYGIQSELTLQATPRLDSNLDTMPFTPEYHPKEANVELVDMG